MGRCADLCHARANHALVSCVTGAGNPARDHPAKARARTMQRFSAKLLFEFRVAVDGVVGRRRLCEERIIVLHARSAKAALAQAKRKGKKGETRYRNGDGNPVHFAFIGVMDLLCLGLECDPDEVWYDIVERLAPSERKSKWIPPEAALNAMRDEK